MGQGHELGPGAKLCRFACSLSSVSLLQDRPLGPANTAFPNVFLTPAGFDWAVWEEAFGHATPPAPAPASPLQARVEWLLQLGGPRGWSAGSASAEEGYDRFAYVTAMMDNALERADPGIRRRPVSFGDYVTANLYWPASARATRSALPVAIWLHPYSYATGYCPEYGSASAVSALVRAGYAVLAYDQIGFGMRLREGGTAFYHRYGGRASLFGHMVRDARAALDFVTCLTAAGRGNRTLCPEPPPFPWLPSLADLPELDPDRILLAGYSLGGNVALHTAALDPRAGAVAAFAAFTPFRTDTNDRPTHGLRRLYDLHALLPRLGLFRANTAAVPYDYDELLRAVAPRNTLLYTPLQDRDATAADVARCIAAARPAWEGRAAGRLQHVAPDTYTAMGAVEVAALSTWAQQWRRGQQA